MGKGVRMHTHVHTHAHTHTHTHRQTRAHTHTYTLRNGKHINDTWCANMATAAQCVRVWATHGEETGRGTPVVIFGAPSGTYRRTAAHEHQPGATMFRRVRLQAWQFSLVHVTGCACSPSGFDQKRCLQNKCRFTVTFQGAVSRGLRCKVCLGSP
jgi:hypothetical protein